MWQTIKQYADLHNVSPTAIYKRINKGTIATKIVKGLKMVSDNLTDIQLNLNTVSTEKEDLNTAYQRRVEAKAKIENALKMLKLKNLRQDTILKKQKQTITKLQYRQLYVLGVFECFTDSFANVKNIFIELKLNKQQNLLLKKAFAKAFKNFEARLKKYLADKDKLELKENEATEVE